jgi:hypothetical protein
MPDAAVWYNYLGTGTPAPPHAVAAQPGQRQPGVAE